MHHKTVKDAMTASPRTISASTPIAEAAKLMRDENVGSLPIVDGDRLEAIVTDRDIAIRAVADQKLDATAGSIASKQLVTVDPGQPLDEAARLMAEHQVRRLPVCEEDGRLVGMLAQADVATHGGHDSARRSRVAPASATLVVRRA